MSAAVDTPFSHYLRLPSQVTPFEREYLARVNLIARVFFALHVPVMTTIAFVNGTRPLVALLLTALCAAGPFYASTLFATRARRRWSRASRPPAWGGFSCTSAKGRCRSRCTSIFSWSSRCSPSSATRRRSWSPRRPWCCTTWCSSS